MIALCVLLFVSIAQAEHFISPGRESEIQSLARPLSLGSTITPQWTLEAIRIERSSVVFVVKDAHNTTAELIASHRDDTPNASQTTPSFALTLRAQNPAAQPALQALAESIRANDHGTFWNAEPTDRPQEHPAPITTTAQPTARDAPRTASTTQPSSTSLGLWLLALVLLVAPVALGLALGRVSASRLQTWRPTIPRGVLLAAGVLVVWLLTYLSSRWIESVPVWDVVLCGVLLSAGFAAGFVTRPTARDRARLIVLSLSSTLAMVLVECGLRLVVHTHPIASGTRTVQQWVMQSEPSCAALYDPEPFIAERLGYVQPEQATQPMVMHLGDSMVQGIGAGGPSVAFPAVLNTLGTGRKHFNAGIIGAPPEVELFLFERWSRTLQPSAVVWYIYLGNDLLELGRRFACCNMEPLYTHVNNTISERCPSPRWRLTYRHRTEHSPAPLLVRLLAPHSVLAAHVAVALPRIANSLGRRGWLGLRIDEDNRKYDDDRMTEFQSIATQLVQHARARNIPIAWVILPPRQEIERSLGHTTTLKPVWESVAQALDARDKILTLARSLNVPAVDAWDAVREQLQRDGADTFFTHDMADDFHYSAHTHQWLARWLRPHLHAWGMDNGAVQ